MVRLTKIYTRTGDGGQTRLGDMSQVPKTSLRIEAYGCVDELNSALGLVRTTGSNYDDLLGRVQNDLFDIGADLCVPRTDAESKGEKLRLQPTQVQYLERQIDRINESLQPLKSFVLPSGTPQAAWLHLARTVCRRAERRGGGALGLRRPRFGDHACEEERAEDIPLMSVSGTRGSQHRLLEAGPRRSTLDRSTIAAATRLT